MLIAVTHLILVQFTSFELLFSFALKSDDHKTNEDVDHEEGDDDDIDDVVDSHPWTIVLEWTLVYVSGVDGMLQDTTKQ